MDLSNRFDVPVSPEAAFALLLDVERVIGCVPGAELVERVDERTYRCKVTLRLGPVALTFRGTASIDQADPVARTARLTLRGTDEKGRGGADAVVHFAVQADGAGTQVDVRTTLTLTGLVAQYGRGGGIVQGLAAELTREFAARLRATLA